MDRRIKRTKNLIKQALFHVASQKGISAVTVQDIVNEADINRATFYYHYKDKQDLLENTLDEMLHGLAQDIVLSDNLQPFTDTVHLPVLAAFEHVQNHLNLYKVILSEKGIPDFHRRMLTIIKNSVRNNILLWQKNKKNLITNEEFLVNYISGGLVALILEWIKTDSPDSPSHIAEKMALVVTYGIYEKN